MSSKTGSMLLLSVLLPPLLGPYLDLQQLDMEYGSAQDVVTLQSLLHKHTREYRWTD